MLEEEERQSVNAESLAEMFTEVREQKATDAAAAAAGEESEMEGEVVTPGPEAFTAAPDSSRPERNGDDPVPAGEPAKPHCG